jgi:hypothetical protein
MGCVAEKPRITTEQVRRAVANLPAMELMMEFAKMPMRLCNLSVMKEALR